MQLAKPRLRQPREPDPELPVGPDGKAGSPGALDADEQQCLMLNLDAALQVHARPHFFAWAQGLLQNLSRHEVLICVQRGDEAFSLSVDSIAVNVADPSVFSDAFIRDAQVAPALVKAWEERRFRPVVCAAIDLKGLAGGTFARELERLGATQLVVHGTHDAAGRMQSLFVFACVPGGDPRRQAYLAQLLVPFLHAAWMRVRMNARTRNIDAARPAKKTTITPREREILKWIYLGKSNLEIGAILSISPLTVKNHVQKILRKLNVVNRAQAVGKAFDLRILSP